MSRTRKLASGEIVGGIFFKRAALLHILRNRVYVGDLNHRGRSHPGEHEPIVPQSLFDAVQRKTDAALKEAPLDCCMGMDFEA